MQTRHRPFVAIMFALILAEVTAAFETATIYAALPKIIATFGDPVRVGWLVTAYLLVGAGGAAVAGRLGDIFGRRRLTLILLATSVFGSALSASTEMFGIILVGRAFQGLSTAILPLSFGLVRENLSPAHVPMGVGLLISGASAGIATGLVIGGVIVDHVGWHGVFAASAGLAALSFVAVWLIIPASVAKPAKGKLDLIGGVLFVPGVAGLLLAFSIASKSGWTSGTVIALFIGSLAVLALWIFQSLRHPDPLINVRLFADRNVGVANGITAIGSLGALQITLVFTLLLQAPLWTGIGLGLSATVAGLVKLPSNIASLFAGPLSGWLTGVRDARIVLLTGGLVTTSGWLLVLAYHGSALVVGLILCIISFGTSMIFAATSNVVVAAVPDERISEATGMLTVVRTTFMAVGAQIVAVLLATESVTAPGGGTSFPSGGAFMLTIGVIAGLSLLTALLALRLPRGIRGPGSIAAA